MSYELSNTVTIICVIAVLLICCYIISLGTEGFSLSLPPATQEKILKSFLKNNIDNQIAQIINDQQVNNFIFSPRSLKISLALLYLGSTGLAHKILSQYFDNIKPELIIVYYTNNDYQLTKSENIKIGNSIWNGNRVKIRMDYSNIIKSIADMCSFNKSTEDVQNKINYWVTRKTDNMITNIPFNINSTLVIINALYFNDKWKYPFEKSNTKQEQFFITNKSSDFIYVPMMFQNLKTLYYNDDNISAISLPYTSPFAMIVTIDNNGNFISSAHLLDLISKMKKRDVNIKIPKFTCENEIELVPILERVGMKNIFTSNYLKISNDPLIYVNNIIQKIKIEVDESGTKDSAITNLKIRYTANKLEGKWFIANVPFNYYIIYLPTKEILFMGRYKGSDL